MDINGIAVFVKVVQEGSFSRAASRLGIPNTTASAKVAGLERRLGVTLIRRTTRKLHLTDAGGSYFQKCVHAMEELEAAERELSSSQKEPKGTLRITAPVDISHTLLPPLVRAYLARFPSTSVELIITNRIVDLIAEGIDLAIRAGELKDSSLIAKKLVAANLALFASREYLKTKGRPEHPRDLLDHNGIRFTSLKRKKLTLSKRRESREVEIPHRLSVDDLETAKQFTLLGEGIAVLPEFLCKKEVATGELVRLLPEWSLGGGSFSLVFPAQRYASPKIKAFLELVTEIEG